MDSLLWIFRPALRPLLTADSISEMLVGTLCRIVVLLIWTGLFVRLITLTHVLFMLWREYGG